MILQAAIIQIVVHKARSIVAICLCVAMKEVLVVVTQLIVVPPVKVTVAIQGPAVQLKAVAVLQKQVAVRQIRQINQILQLPKEKKVVAPFKIKNKW